MLMIKLNLDIFINMGDLIITNYLCCIIVLKIWKVEEVLGCKLINCKSDVPNIKVKERQMIGENEENEQATEARIGSVTHSLIVVKMQCSGKCQMAIEPNRQQDEESKEYILKV